MRELQLKGMQRCLLIIFSLTTIGTTSYAQTYKEINWSVTGMLGASNMMSDLGGSNFVGNRGLFDVDMKATRPAIGVGGAMHVGSFSLDIGVVGTWLYGDDKLSEQDIQVERNLCVRTNLWEADAVLVFRPLSRSYNMSRFYLYGGIGAMKYTPKAKLGDDWFDLRELGTEGQNLAGNTPYKEIEMVIPYGFGYKFRLNKVSSLVLDFGFRKTFTDYLDDVSGTYPDRSLLLASDNGATAVALSDRSLSGAADGAARGNPEVNDMFAIVGLKYERILGGSSGDGCYYNRNPPKTRSTRINQRRMFTR